MKINVKQGSLTEAACDVLIVNLFQGVKEPAGATGAVDKALGGAISDTIREEEFEGCLGHTTVVRGCDAIGAKKVLLVGLGKQDKLDALRVMRAAGKAARKCRKLKAKHVVSILHGAGAAGLSVFECGRATTLGTILGVYEYSRLKTKDSRENPIEQFDIVELSAEKLDNIEQGMQRAEVIGNAVTYARDLVNEPSNIVTPSYLAEQAQEIARHYGMDCSVKDRQGIVDAGMGLLAAVARGSSVEPRFIEMHYKAPGAGRTVAIIGKGVTFDTGGYSLKRAESMYGMKDDMAGAAAVLGTMKAIGQLKPNVNVVALIPATENSIGGSAIHPGDVFKSLDGKTVEINNTDAEGRLILADAIAYAKSLGVDSIIDAATLTGACVVALGREIAGVFGNDQEMMDTLIKAGKSTGEELWQLPLYMDYKDGLKSDVADLKNTGGRDGGAINGALFIHSFVGDTPWAHIDLSSSMAHQDTDLARKGATGVATGMFIEYLMSL